MSEINTELKRFTIKVRKLARTLQSKTDLNMKKRDTIANSLFDEKFINSYTYFAICASQQQNLRRYGS